MKNKEKVKELLKRKKALYVREIDLTNTYSGFSKISDPCKILFHIKSNDKFLIEYYGGSNYYQKIVPLKELELYESPEYNNDKYSDLDLDDRIIDSFGHKNVIKGFNGFHEYIVKNLDNGIYNVIDESMIEEIIYRGGNE